MITAVATSPKRRLLVLARRVPWPLNSGGRIRLHHFLRELTRTWEVTCATLESPIEDVALPAEVNLLCGDEIRRTPKQVIPNKRLSIGRRFFGFDQAIAAWLQEVGDNQTYDAVFISGATNGVYVGEAKLPTAWDLCDELLLAEWRKLRRNWLRLRRALQTGAIAACHQREAGGKADLTLVASDVDAQWLRVCNPAAIEAVSNGVDFDFFSEPGEPPSDSKRVVFVGALEFPPNIDAVCWFAKTVWPKVLAAHPTATLQLVGRNPIPSVRALARQSGIEIHANVPDVRPYFRDARLVIAPLRMGGGVKNKILEACAMQRTTVTSPLGLGDLSVPRGEAVLVATRTRDWIFELSRLLSDQKLCRQIGRAARSWVRKNHSWSEIGSTLDRLIGGLLEPKTYHTTQTPAGASLRITSDRSPQIG